MSPSTAVSPVAGFSPRADRLAALERTHFDVLVVGGGITGAAAARDAASRGLSVAIVEKEDWAAGTSSRSSKLVHGGLRYLARGHLGLVFESLSERARLLRLAPHLVRPLEFLFAILRGSWVSPAALSAGLTLYDLLALGRGQRHRRLSASALFVFEPLLSGADLAGGALYADASTDDARLTLENVIDAATLGAIAVSRLSVESRLHDSAGATTGAVVRDVETGRAFDVRARVTIDATGPWSDRLRARDDPSAAPRLRLSKGVHVTVPAAALPVLRAVSIPVERGRLVFAIPSGPVTLIGTTDTEYDGPADGVAADGGDVAYLLARAGEAFPRSAPRARDVLAVFAGLRPLRFEPGRDVARTSREEAIDVTPGAVAVTGGKLTTHRRMGERAVDAAAVLLRELGIRAGRSRTADRPFPGAPAEPLAAFTDGFVRQAQANGATLETARHLAGRYGRRAPAVVALAAAEPSLWMPIVSGLPDPEAEILFAARGEDARSASDVLIRRTHLFWQSPGQAISALPRVYELLGKELGWTPQARERSREEYVREVERSAGAVAPLLEAGSSLI
ncbi:MAG TPA: glycerol-3-phosphate dehydrogenase/oxidase [Thermoanaerobaculia bacterium]|nr:glycerol-3-phosphate dehydrogenase/oxidase [Thermoanaerobaculia bacterium]